MAFCASCGEKIETGIKFCSSCGNAVTVLPVVPIVQQESVILQSQSAMSDEKYCFSCGSVIKKISDLCPKCGVRQNMQSSSTIDKKLSNLALFSIILLTISYVIPFFYHDVYLTFMGANFNGITYKAIWVFSNIAALGCFIIGLIAFIGLKTKIETAISYVIIMLVLLSIHSIYSLFRILVRG